MSVKQTLGAATATARQQHRQHQQGQQQQHHQQQQRRQMLLPGLLVAVILLSGLPNLAASAAVPKPAAAIAGPWSSFDLAVKKFLTGPSTTPAAAAAARPWSNIDHPVKHRRLLQSGVFRPMFVLLGDSITEKGAWQGGWQQQLEGAFVRKADIINRGFGWYTSRLGLYLVDEFLNGFGAGRVKLVTINFGANDAAVPDSGSQYLAVPLEEFKANLAALVRKLRARGVANVLLITPSPVNDKTVKDRRNERTKLYANAVLAVGKQIGVPVADFYYGATKNPGWAGVYLTPDGLHLSDAGNKLMGDIVLGAINSNFKAISQWSLPKHMPNPTPSNAVNPGPTFDQLYGYAVQTGVAPAPATSKPSSSLTSSKGSNPATNNKSNSSNSSNSSGSRGNGSTAAAKGSQTVNPPVNKGGQTVSSPTNSKPAGSAALGTNKNRASGGAASSSSAPSSSSSSSGGTSSSSGGSTDSSAVDTSSNGTGQ